MKAQGKRFLTDRGDEGGSVRWYVKVEGVDSDGDASYYKAEAELYISDCSRTINLEFSCKQVKDLDKRIAKVQQLIAELEDFKQALHKAKIANLPHKFSY